MPLDEVDKGYLWDMKEACKDILQFTEGLSFHEFENNGSSQEFERDFRSRKLFHAQIKSKPAGFEGAVSVRSV